MKVSDKKINDALKKKGYPLFTGEANITLVGVRSKNTDCNSFNDLLVVFFEQDGKQVAHRFDMTSDPGIFYRKQPMNLDGTAVLAPGHYSGCWKRGAHRGQYRALVQADEMAVYRDNNNDAKIDTDGNIQRGLFGINLHRANAHVSSLRVDRWSAGCQVMANPDDFDAVMAMVDASAKKYGERFSYTLLDEREL